PVGMSEFQCMEFAAVLENEIFFAGSPADIEEDSFRRMNKCLSRMIRNKNHQFLVADQGLVFENGPVEQAPFADRRFSIEMYGTTECARGVAVVIRFFSEGCWHVVRCTQEGSRKKVEASPQSEQVPDYVPDSCNDAVFFLQAVEGQSNKFMFESSRWRCWFLAFSAEGGFYKLVLQPRADEVDERQLFTL
uniref:Uncharacterized protein n=1 Tax=Lepisosteus oculatus TaxID=7918 RepID=W5MG35_LEPOC